MIRVRSPQLSQNFPWLNCDRSLSLKELRGRIVLLDFWTYGCINCLHVISDLHYLAQKYSPHLTVIGIHSAKFDHEQDVSSLQQAILRYGITHPVVVDRDRTLWDQFAIRAYPTFVLIDARGYIAATLSGEGKRHILDSLIEQLIAETAEQAILSNASMLNATPSGDWATAALAFPGKVFAHEASDTLFIADTGHHRIVITRLDGTLKGTIGTGVVGLRDGTWDVAQFSAPQGMAFDASNQILYVADAGNHCIRQIDLRQKQVTTIAGTGLQSQILFPHGGRSLDVALNSPWDLALLNEELYIAMAGSHQIWQMNLANQTIQTYLGTGAEYCVDGSPEVAAFAQPHGITTDGSRLFVADSETSSIRVMTCSATPTVQTLCGQGDLFQFGDRDGIGAEAHLQHCSGLVFAKGFLWVADTYNHKIKRVHPITGECCTVVENNTSGLTDGSGTDAQFWEPSGLSFAGDRLYIADTNNHAIRCMDLDAYAVTTLPLTGLCAPTLCIVELTA